MSSSVTLSAATRQNLLSLQDTSALTATTQNRLATGLKVSSALDNPVNFFTAQSFSSRSGDLNSLLDSISNGIQTIQAANQGITSIQKLIDSAKSTANQALSTQITTTGTAASDFAASTTTSTSVTFFVNGASKTASIATNSTIDAAITSLNSAAGSTMFSKDTTGKKIVLNASAAVEFATTAGQTALGFAAGTGSATADKYGSGNTAASNSANLTISGVEARTKLAEQYNSLLIQITQLAKDSSFNGVNLISSSDASNKLHITFNERDTANLDVQGRDLTADGLNLTSITGNSGATANGQGNFLLDTDIKGTLTKLTGASDTLRTASSTFGSNLSVVQNRQDFTKRLVNILDTGASNLTNADLNEEAANSQALSTRQSLGISALSLANQAQQGILQLLR
ncbi:MULTISPECIES: flagellin [Methylorubrum]|uniref:flagellin N-terminal helical domain-containing protein n=1 Tax=Methylorubrum TaxID=2282523 RepID=UPI0020A0F196|nr:MULTISPECIES: flagellin [Methylorubrum]MCP1547166.1 flagellin-like hook-associated protein FlgL [Methylorubrum zatmanii]MCP1556218.1 flagellin-like hook-associated protein FlgL [Methylorubrum extorquens]MCP1577469.1 flagellin-like hook-associated protein FlgL [Methylorubrum extorquens]